MAREELAAAGVAPGQGKSEPGLMPFSPSLSEAQAETIARAAEMFALRLVDTPRHLFLPAHSGAQLESASLLEATYCAASMGYSRVFWPVSAAIGDSLDLDRVAQITDTALLVGRLVALDAASHGIASIHVHCPFADLASKQIVELIEDMGVNVAA